MTAKVRIFTLDGVTVAPVVSGTRLSYDSVQLLKLPYQGRDLLECTTVAADLSESAAATTKTALAYVQVEAGKAVHYEVTPQGFELRTADVGSPILRGDTTIGFGPGWQISVLEAAI